MLSNIMLTTSANNITINTTLPLNSNFINPEIISHEKLKRFAQEIEENNAKIETEYRNKRVKRNINEEKDQYQQQREEGIKSDKCNEINFNAGKNGYYKTIEEWLFCGKSGKGLYNCFLGITSLCSSSFNRKPQSQCANEAYILGEESSNNRQVNLDQLKCAPKSQKGVYFITDLVIDKKTKLVIKKKCTNTDYNTLDCKLETSRPR